MADLFGPATSLMESNASQASNINSQTSADSRNTKSLLASQGNNAADHAAALQQLLKTQQGQQVLQKAQQAVSLKEQAIAQEQENQRQMERLKQERDLKLQYETVFITPQVAKGLDEQGIPTFKSFVGQRIPTALYTATIMAHTKSEIAALQATTKRETAAARPDTTNKDLLAVERQITANTAQLQKAAKDPNFPQEAFGGQPATLDKILQYVSSGNLGNLSAAQKAQVGYVKGLADQLLSQQQRAEALRAKLPVGAGNTGGASSGGTADDVANGFGF